MRLILASASPARLLTLQRAGVAPEVIVSQVDETNTGLLDPRELTKELARRKAEAVAARLDDDADVIVIGCDSVLDFAGKVLGKPGTPAAAAALWHRINGGEGTLVTGHHVMVRSNGATRTANRNAETVVRFADLTEAEIEAYSATGEPERVAGGFTIDGIGGPFVTSITGDPHNVVGISLPLVRMMLADLQVPWHTLWTPGV